ncbi:MAG TPA: GyrI-like domain-containing protein [Flavobacteriales bacterium]|nr:GyrI-like domain-containing protein [Flavobacteriales bacterium]
MAMMNTTPELITTRKTATAMIRLVIPCQDMGEHMDTAVQEVFKVIAGQGVPITGPMFCHHHRKPDDTFDFEIGFPVGHAIGEEGRVKNGVLPAARVVRSVYQGHTRDWPRHGKPCSVGRVNMGTAKQASSGSAT